MKNIAILASGEGTNAQNIINYFKASAVAKVVLVVSNNPHANVLKKASDAGVKTLVVNRESFYENTTVVNFLNNERVDLIVLAGFLWMVPENLIAAFPDKIINVHPALLPKFGGKGMFGINVHKAVSEAKEQESGITIHYVNEQYDEGRIIAQYKCAIDANDSPEKIAQKIHALEQQYFPLVIENVLNAQSNKINA